MHLHLVQMQILDRQVRDGAPTPPAATEAGWKDTVAVGPFETVRVIARFEDHAGLFPYHCHVIEHEDHAMMRQFRTIDPAAPPDAAVPDAGEATDGSDGAGGDAGGGGDVDGDGGGCGCHGGGGAGGLAALVPFLIAVKSRRRRRGPLAGGDLTRRERCSRS